MQGNEEVSYSILLVSDDPVNGALIARRLWRHGHRVWINTGDEREPVGAGMARRRFDVILIDRAMSPKKALAVLLAVKHEPAHEWCPMVNVSAYDVVAVDGNDPDDLLVRVAGAIDNAKFLRGARFINSIGTRGRRDTFTWARDRFGRIRRVKVI